MDKRKNMLAWLVGILVILASLYIFFLRPANNNVVYRHLAPETGKAADVNESNQLEPGIVPPKP